MEYVSPFLEHASELRRLKKKYAAVCCFRGFCCLQCKNAIIGCTTLTAIVLVGGLFEPEQGGHGPRQFIQLLGNITAKL